MDDPIIRCFAQTNMNKDLVPGRMGSHVKVGASMPAGLRGCKLLVNQKLGNIMLTLLPTDKQEALQVAEYCRCNHIYLIFSELVWRGTSDLNWAARRKIPREEFFSKEAMEEIARTGGDYYLGRITIGEIGAVLYGPKSYWIDRAAGDWDALPQVETVDDAKEAYLAEIRKFLDFERSEIGGGPLWDTDAGCTFKYHLEAGVDFPLLEAMPGDYTFMTAAIRGAARAYAKPWGIHIAMACYGGITLDALWLKRWKISLYHSFISGSDFVYPESGHFGYDQTICKYDFSSPEMVEVRRILREFNQFCQIHSRPENGPKVRLGFVYGNLDGYPGLWNKYVWGQYEDKWLFGDAERGWEYLDDAYRKGRWDDENLQGESDFYGQPPCGHYDVVPIEAPLDVLREYSCLVFLGWNIMTGDIYEKLKRYVEFGGHLVMSVPHLSVETDRAKPWKLFNDGDWRDLFGVVVEGPGESGVAGIKTFNHSTLSSYKMPVWRVRTDPRFMGSLATAKSRLEGARVISGLSDFYYEDEEKLSANPVLTEYSLGKGKAFLLHSWTYPGHEGWSPYVRHLLRVVSVGEQGGIRIKGSDRIRYAVYDSSGITCVYLLNTDYDTPSRVDLWVNGRVCPRISVDPVSLSVSYLSRNLLICPDDRGVEMTSWETDGDSHRIDLFCRKDIGVRLCNLSDEELKVHLNGHFVTIEPSKEKFLHLQKRVDPERPEFYVEDFLNEPAASAELAGESGDMSWAGDLPY